MFISFELPSDIENDLRRELGDLNLAAREAFIIESYRAGRISLGAVAQLIGAETTIQAQQRLAGRGIALNYSHEDLENDRRTLDRLFGEEA